MERRISFPHCKNITISVTGGGAASDIFVSKLNCSNGDIQWITAFGGAGADDTGQDIINDPAGNSYVVGGYSGTFTLNTITAPAPSGTSDLFVAKFTPTGVLSWFSQGGATGAADMATSGRLYLLCSPRCNTGPCCRRFLRRRHCRIWKFYRYQQCRR
ncbi:MAG: SBBP repeat-containing protein [Bacteroidota bacterium]